MMRQFLLTDGELSAILSAAFHAAKSFPSETAEYALRSHAWEIACISALGARGPVVHEGGVDKVVQMLAGGGKKPRKVVTIRSQYLEAQEG